MELFAPIWCPASLGALICRDVFKLKFLHYNLIPNPPPLGGYSFVGRMCISSLSGRIVVKQGDNVCGIGSAFLYRDDVDLTRGIGREDLDLTLSQPS